ncbi:MerR family DNA-binding transcriptional regulator [Shewanella sp. ULN5]|uniref:MerR family transcriptional regulator n=1 Tax=Shewanella sp. ULN5 TaxID=2994678 RepID=UPI00273D4C6E|nr:MerR family transcriptional regulator [Shewanella sp. ULN5]MDP5145594.1 MerR family DNA-binding transcriptional regulator [Shewanella sp. ULN5]
MYIGEFAKLTGTTPKTIRFYESIGLMPEPLRKGKYLVYDHTYIETVKQIKRAQDSDSVKNLQIVLILNLIFASILSS